MEIGIGLPNPVPGTPGHALLEFAQSAEARGFAGLATIDRIAYPSYDSLATMAAVAGATNRIPLLTNILLAPIYPPALLTKTAASVDQLSAGRLTLGLAPGGRADDFALANRDFHTRGRDFDTALDFMHRAWRGEPVGDSQSPSICPTPINDRRVPILIGGASEQAIRRTVTWGAGFTAGGGQPEQAAQLFDRVRNAWTQAGKSGEPRLAALAYFSLGNDVAEESRTYLHDYYAFTGPYAEQIAESALRSPSAIREAIAAFSDIGCTELYFDATSADPDQVHRLADIVF
jgi:alkanesulfonate monooxygenase SsuD/methylene tetrahydromethanopterin reductase-like flavin-dependent oxidoreductase (luciferase family)